MPKRNLEDEALIRQFRYHFILGLIVEIDPLLDYLAKEEGKAVLGGDPEAIRKSSLLFERSRAMKEMLEVFSNHLWKRSFDLRDIEDNK